MDWDHRQEAQSSCVSEWSKSWLCRSGEKPANTPKHKRRAITKSFCFKFFDVKFFKINIVNCLVLKNGFKKGRGIDPHPFLCSVTYILGNLCGLQISAVIALMTGHSWTHNTTADFTGRPNQTTTMITPWGGIGLLQALRAFNETFFIDQGLTPGNIDIHPQYSFSEKLHKSKSINSK